MIRFAPIVMPFLMTLIGKQIDCLSTAVMHPKMKGRRPIHLSVLTGRVLKTVLIINKNANEAHMKDILKVNSSTVCVCF